MDSRFSRRCRQGSLLSMKRLEEGHLRNCLRIAESFPDEQILHILCTELSWSHLRLIGLLDDPLTRLVAIDLKLGSLKHEFKSQMELYLRWLDKHEQEEGENPPLGIILCAGKKQEQIEQLELDKSGIHVAEYLTVLPPRETLQAKLYQSIETARRRLLNKDK